ncbi:MAG: Crp/Fnr family transcriptional regulator [Prolixibacteraceae bacterium]|jgi:CRP/FNR family transcriptional regulator|nr:Crp/Fnr family transcriptional regulator [Prolixibacteraceae bacterium]
MEIHNIPVSVDVIRKRFPFFEATLIEDISKEGEWVTVEEGDELMSEGKYIRSFPIVLEGLIKVCRNDAEGREVLLYYLNPGQVCAMALTCCMGRMQSNIGAYAETDTEIIRIPVDCLDQWMVKYTTWKEFVMYAYRNRFDELLTTIDSIAFKKMDERLLKFFDDRFKATGKTVYTGTHQDIANSLTTSREVVSRLLKQLEKEGSVTIGRNKIDFAPLV